jgi:hypothetical protein
MSAMTTFLPNITRLAFTAATLAVAALVGLPDRVAVAKAQLSPFAGTFLVEGPFYDVQITISDSGRIQGPFVGLVGFDFGALAYVVAEISGSIANDGSLKVKDTLVRYDRTTGKRIDSFSNSYIGVGALDESGNLYGVLTTKKGEYPREFSWRRSIPIGQGDP